MAHEYRQVRLVEFADTDLAGIVHFANFFRYMEETEHGFLRSLGLSVHSREGSRVWGLPRVNAACTFTQPLRYQDEVEVHLQVREKKEKSLTYEFVFRKLGTDPPPEVARGSLTVVSVGVDPETGGMKAVPLPEGVARQVEVAPVE